MSLRRYAKTMPVAVAALVFLALSMSAQQAKATWTNTSAAVTKVYVTGSGTVYVVLDPTAGVTNTNSCSNWTEATFEISSLATDTGRAMLSEAQLSFATGDPVAIDSLGCSYGGTSGTNTIDGIAIIKP